MELARLFFFDEAFFDDAFFDDAFFDDAFLLNLDVSFLLCLFTESRLTLEYCLLLDLLLEKVLLTDLLLLGVFFFFWEDFFKALVEI